MKPNVLVLHLANKKFENLQLDHDHSHTETCHQCVLLLSTIEVIGNLVSDVSKDQDKKDKLMYDVNMAKSNIFEWMAHIVKRVQQEKAKYMSCSYCQLQQDFG